jgi:hypothetical protein
MASHGEHADDRAPGRRMKCYSLAGRTWASSDVRGGLRAFRDSQTSRPKLPVQRRKRDFGRDNPPEMGPARARSGEAHHSRLS